mgnify:CR=1 FL=1
MKKLFSISVALFAFCAMASAQSMGGGSTSFGTLSLSYNAMNLKMSYEGESATESMTGLSLTWTNANAIGTAAPLYFEYGLGAQFSFKSKNNTTVNFLSAKIPLSILYNFEIPGTSFAIAPYAGLDAVCYFMGKSKYSYGGETYESDVFKDGDPKYNRFNIGWHIGAKVLINTMFVGFAYEGPILGFYSKDGLKVNSNQVNISLGLVF